MHSLYNAIVNCFWNIVILKHVIVYFLELQKIIFIPVHDIIVILILILKKIMCNGFW